MDRLKWFFLIYIVIFEKTTWKTPLGAKTPKKAPNDQKRPKKHPQNEHPVFGHIYPQIQFNSHLPSIHNSKISTPLKLLSISLSNYSLSLSLSQTTLSIEPFSLSLIRTIVRTRLIVSLEVELEYENIKNLD